MFQKIVLCVFLTNFVVTQAGDYQQTKKQWDMSHQNVQPESQAFIENVDHDFTLSSSGAPSGHDFFGVYKPDTIEDYEEEAQVPLRPPLPRLSPEKSSKPGKSGKDKFKYDKDSSSEDTKYSPFGKDFGKYSSEEQKPKFGGKSYKIGIDPHQRPIHKQYCTEESRKRTFKEWTQVIKQKPDQLAEAGFFYNGRDDQTICFHCNVGLKDWEENDDPWEQHARWSPKCIYVLLNKGKEFVQQVSNRNSPVPSAKEALNQGPYS